VHKIVTGTARAASSTCARQRAVGATPQREERKHRIERNRSRQHDTGRTRNGLAVARDAQSGPNVATIVAVIGDVAHGRAWLRGVKTSATASVAVIVGAKRTTVGR